MGSALKPRRLTSLTGQVGLNYFRRALPPAWLALSLMGAGALWMAISSHDLIAFTASALAISGILVHWPRRGRQRWPVWRALAFVGLALLEHVPGHEHPGLRAALYAIAAICVAQALQHLLASIRLSLRVQRSASRLDDASLLALLPPEAREDARRWQHGDDSKSAEVSLVVQLAALWLALSSVGAAPPPAHTQLPM